MKPIHLTKEEAKALIIQIGARIDALRELQRQEGKNENIERVLELEKFMHPIISGKEKIEKELYSL